MAVQLTAAQARALGVDVPASSAGRRRGTRRAVPGHGVSRCHDCGELFTTDAAETRHVARGHARFESLFTVTPGVYAATMTDTDPDVPPDDDDDDGDDDDQAELDT